jgi:chromosome segregation ATPase
MCDMTAHDTAEAPADLAAAAAELYGLEPGRFTQARNERARQARADGDADLAEAVKALPKPSAAAWLVNMMVRRMGDEIDQVLQLGAALRQAQQDLDAAQLRTLNSQRRRLTTALVRQAGKRAAQLGQKVSAAVADQAEATLHAAMTDEDAAAALRSGLLVRPLEAAGLGGVDLDGAVAVPGAVDLAPREPEDEEAGPGLHVVADNTRAIEEAQEEVDAAEFVAEGAERALRRAEEKVRKIEARGLQLRAEIEELRRQIDERETRLQAVEDDLAAADEQRDAAEEGRDEAAAALAAARKTLTRLQR